MAQAPFIGHFSCAQCQAVDTKVNEAQPGGAWETQVETLFFLILGDMEREQVQPDSALGRWNVRMGATSQSLTPESVGPQTPSPVLSNEGESHCAFPLWGVCSAGNARILVPLGGANLA